MPSAYSTKILKRAKVGNVKIYLKAYQKKSLMRVPNARGLGFHWAEDKQRETLYYIVSATDGSLRKIYHEEQALVAFEQLINFEKRQTKIKIEL